MSACHAEDRGFDSRQLRHYADVAQLVEQLTCNQQVAGSSPIVGSKKRQEAYRFLSLFLAF